MADQDQVSPEIQDVGPDPASEAALLYPVMIEAAPLTLRDRWRAMLSRQVSMMLIVTSGLLGIIFAVYYHPLVGLGVTAALLAVVLLYSALDTRWAYLVRANKQDNEAAIADAIAAARAPKPLAIESNEIHARAWTTLASLYIESEPKQYRAAELACRQAIRHLCQTLGWPTHCWDMSTDCKGTMTRHWSTSSMLSQWIH